jgi:sec-independent protein translocase protein TatC
LLGAGGVVSAKLLRVYRRHVIVALCVLAMLLTPPDPFTMVLMALPLVVLYEATIWLVLGIEKRRANPFLGQR